MSNLSKTQQAALDFGEFLAAVYYDGPIGAGSLHSAMQLCVSAAKLSRMYERACNYPQTPRTERALAKLEGHVRERANALGSNVVKVMLNGDSRGYAVKVLLTSGRYNTWGGAENGWGVPEL